MLCYGLILWDSYKKARYPPKKNYLRIAAPYMTWFCAV